MLFWIFVFLLVLGIIALVFCSYNGVDFLKAIGAFLSTIGAIGLFVSIIILCCTYIPNEAYINRMNTRYDMLTYQYENDIYDNDNDLGKRELMEDIRDWNEDLSSRRELQDNFWVGIYYPNIYDQFEFIELK